MAAAEKANLAKSDFLSSMSHELRSPLNAILGFAQLINSDSPPPTPAQVASIDQILHAGWYLLDLINEILDLAQIESGKLALSREPTSLAEVMLECQAMIEPQAQKRGITDDVSGVCRALLCRCRSDPAQTGTDQSAFERDQVQPSQWNGDRGLHSEHPNRLRVSVRDAARGLSPDMLVQLFQPFNRLGRETSREEGTGIGLVMSKRLVELMGGTIGVESTVGSGSVFWFELNAVCRSSTGVSRPGCARRNLLRARSAGAPMRTLLYVEDNPANLKLIEQLDRSPSRYAPVGCRRRRSGHPTGARQPSGVILMDINLPGISGIEALKILREDPATAHIPVVALSANAMPRDIEKGLQAGFFRYLTKPIKVHEFMETLDVALAFAEHATGQAK